MCVSRHLVGGLCKEAVVEYGTIGMEVEYGHVHDIVIMLQLYLHLLLILLRAGSLLTIGRRLVTTSTMSIGEPSAAKTCAFWTPKTGIS